MCSMLFRTNRSDFAPVIYTAVEQTWTRCPDVQNSTSLASERNFTPLRAFPYVNVPNVSCSSGCAPSASRASVILYSRSFLPRILEKMEHNRITNNPITVDVKRNFMFLKDGWLLVLEGETVLAVAASNRIKAESCGSTVVDQEPWNSPKFS